MPLTINPAFADRRVVHNNVCKKISDHTPTELKDLAIVALKSGNPVLLECFTDMPKLEDLVADKTVVLIKQAKSDGLNGSMTQ